MRVLIQRVSVAALLVMIACLGSGCAGSPPDNGGSEVLGMRLSKAEALIQSSPMIADLSNVVAGRPIGPDFDHPDTWVIVASCYRNGPGGRYSLGVIPMSALTPKIRSQARAGDYRHFLQDCRS